MADLSHVFYHTGSAMLARMFFHIGMSELHSIESIGQRYREGSVALAPIPSSWIVLGTS